MDTADGFQHALSQLEQDGLLLLSDPRLSSLTRLIAGAPVRGSWWGHPAGETIYQVANRLSAHPDLLTVKLIDGKITFVHRTLWSALIAVGTAREDWQLEGLSPEARQLLERVDRDGGLRTDATAMTLQVPGKTLSASADRLEARLLVHGEQVHTERGRHATFLETWQHWADRTGNELPALDPGEAKQRLEAALAALNTRAGASSRLPWMKPTHHSRGRNIARHG